MKQKKETGLLIYWTKEELEERQKLGYSIPNNII